MTIKKLLLFSFFFINYNLFSQNLFKKGYIINSENERIDCYIKDLDWKNNPSKIYYKIDLNFDKVTEGSLENLIEFGVDSSSTYFLANVEIDESSNIIEKLSRNRKPNLVTKKLFLKLLIQGKASLYSYEETNMTRFFYKTQQGNFQQLIYKRFLGSDEIININNDFKNQLWIDLRCEKYPLDKLKSIEYTKDALLKYFTVFNSCDNQNSVEYVSNNKHHIFKLRITSGFNHSGLRNQNSVDYNLNNSFERNASIRAGVELEYLLPFNHYKWGLLIEPTFQSYNSRTGTKDNSNIQYSLIDIPLGLRYYFQENTVNSTNYFTNFHYVPSISYKFKDNLKVKNNVLDISEGNTFAFGLGCRLNKLSMEIRYFLPQNITQDYLYWKSNYSRFAFIISYSILKK